MWGDAPLDNFALAYGFDWYRRGYSLPHRYRATTAWRAFEMGGVRIGR